MGRVWDTLEEHGLDPTAELARILQPVALLNPDGSQVLDSEGRPVLKHRLDDRTRAQMFLALHDFVAPRLKAIDVKVDTSADLTDEQLQQRIDTLLAAERDADD